MTLFPTPAAFDRRGLARISLTFDTALYLLRSNSFRIFSALVELPPLMDICYRRPRNKFRKDGQDENKFISI